MIDRIIRRINMKIFITKSIEVCEQRAKFFLLLKTEVWADGLTDLNRFQNSNLLAIPCIIGAKFQADI